MPRSLIALATATFAIGTTEFAVTGLLPNMASDLGVSVSAVGLLVTGYAAAIVVGAPTLTIALRRVAPKRVLVALMIVFILGTVVSALAPSYAIVLLGRVIAAAAHGGFFAIGAYLATQVVETDRRTSAVATMFLGLTVANVIGVPLGTLVGQHLGWRATFWLIAILAALALLALITLVPSRPADEDQPLRRTLSPFANGRVWLSVAVTALAFGGTFATFTYIVPLLTDTAGWPASAVTWLLVAFGAGVTAGNLAGGRLADRRLDTTIVVSLVLLALVLFGFAAVAHDRIASLVGLILIGLFGFAPNSPLQNRLIRQAECEPTVGSAANIAAVNIGSALGSLLGGVLVSGGSGYPAISVLAGILVSISVVLFAVLARWGGRPSAAAAPG